MVNVAPVSALNVWRDASVGEVELHAPRWPELADLLDGARQTSRAADTAEVLEELVRHAFAAYRILASTPLAPSHPIIGLNRLIASSEEFARRWPAHSVTKVVRTLAKAAAALTSTESVFVTPLETVASRFNSGVFVAPRANLVESIRRVVNDLELDGLAVRTMTELNTLDLDRYDVAIVIGDPGATYASFRTSAGFEARSKGWILTAPPTGHVVLLVAGGCQSVDPDSYWLLDSGCHPDLNVVGYDQDPVRLPAVADHLLETLTQPTVILAPPAIGESTSLARQAWFASCRIAFFSDERGPQPKVVSVGESGSLDISQGCLIDLGPGALIVLRVGQSDSDEIRNRAESRLRREGWTDIDLHNATEKARHLKECLRNFLDSDGTDALSERLQELGLTAGYARVLTHSPLDDDYIAPQEKGYDAFVRAINAPDLLAAKPLLFKMRAARRQAGHEIRHEMQVRLARDLSWTEDVNSDGFAEVVAAGLGSLFVEVVTKVNDECSVVSTSKVGHLLDASGYVFDLPVEDRGPM